MRSETGIEEEETATVSSGSKVKLKPWNRRRGKTLGLEVDGRPAPLIDQVHRLMQLWKVGDVVKVGDFLDARAQAESDLHPTAPVSHRTGRAGH